ncbi:DUF1329 domain-containing protein [Polaromonas sp.]|uniref:DUF1329 domain-containing protein n=1 Tax=Polaromonas sp. TaxID=1869339 RepID=UPI001E1432EC|nr:DUF1329 domain-containing protein [Polaromonas sp.]MBT9475217.1 DUF1329 domain-containing protein [Polaromonas sp.]
MKTKITFVIAASLAALCSQAYAAVSADEAKALGTTLTEFGAIKAGNKEGTIPEYTGGQTKAPADFKPNSGYWADPFKGEKPLYRIDGKNAAQHADKLSESQKHLLKTYPDYYIDVYPTHRSAAYPDSVLKATVRNASTCTAGKDYFSVDVACRGGIPFAIPKNGYEVMWNLTLRYSVATDITTQHGVSWLVDANGNKTVVSDQFTRTERPYYQLDQKDRDPNMILRTYSVAKAPARISGQMTMLTDYLDMDAKPRRAYNYSPGQRRVKLAPEFAYDTPVAQLGGVTLFDELFLFSGKMDRFDFKLVGRKEMLIPYNNYKFYDECKGAQQFTGQHLNPACERWELHRVWVVESTLKPGQRHAYAKRTYFIDEDGSGAGMFDAFDKNGELYRGMFQKTIQLYDQQTPYSGKTVTYDFSKRMLLLIGDVADGGYMVSPKNLPETDMSAEAIVGRETVR